jgi:hypothetical protein
MAFYNFIISLDVLFPGGIAWTKKYDTNICEEVWRRKAEMRNWGAVGSEKSCDKALSDRVTGWMRQNWRTL